MEETRTSEHVCCELFVPFCQILRIVHHVEGQARTRLFNLVPASAGASESPPRGRILHLDMLAVRPSFAGAGLGTALIAHALEVARQEGFRSACCSVSNIRTMHVRARLRYRRVRRFDD